MPSDIHKILNKFTSRINHYYAPWRDFQDFQKLCFVLKFQIHYIPMYTLHRL